MQSQIDAWSLDAAEFGIPWDTIITVRAWFFSGMRTTLIEWLELCEVEVRNEWFAEVE